MCSKISVIVSGRVCNGAARGSSEVEVSFTMFHLFGVKNAATRQSVAAVNVSWRRCDVSVTREGAFALSARLVVARVQQPVNQPVRLPTSGTRRGRGQRCCHMQTGSINMSGMLVNQLRFAGGTF